MDPLFICLAYIVIALAICQTYVDFPLVNAAPLAQDRDYAPLGPEGVLDPLQRMRDTFGTATKIWARGPLRQNSTVSTLRSSPMSAVYRSTLISNASKICKPGSEQSEHKCEVAINGFGSVGEVQYHFNNSKRNLISRSTQVLVACRCLAEECGVALLVRPISLFTKTDDGNIVKSSRRACLYEAVEGKFSDCHSELLRVSQRSRDVLPEFVPNNLTFIYEVEDNTNNGIWQATGQRGWLYDCMDTEVDKLPTVDISKLTATDIAFNKHSTSLSGTHCRGSGNVKYYRDEAGDGEKCAATYEYAVASAAHHATQQVFVAIGKDPTTYLTEKPNLITDTELALSLSAAGLGILFVWSMYRRVVKKKDYKKPVRYLIVEVLKQVFSYALEALPLHIALAQEISCRNWISLFASADGTVALAQDLTGPLGSAQGSVLILGGVFGEVQYLKTREAQVAVLTALFDLVAFGIIAVTISRKVHHLVGKKRQAMYGIDGEAM